LLAKNFESSLRCVRDVIETMKGGVRIELRETTNMKKKIPKRVHGRLVTWSEIGTNVSIIFGFASGLVFNS